MSRARAAVLDASLLVRKGAAIPASIGTRFDVAGFQWSPTARPIALDAPAEVVRGEIPESATVTVLRKEAGVPTVQPQRAAPGQGETVSIRVRLTHDEYQRLKDFAADRHLTRRSVVQTSLNLFLDEAAPAHTRITSARN